ERLGLLGRLIRPEKEVILIVAKESQASAVYEAMEAAADLNRPGKGFLFLQSVDRVTGFLEQDK
ncbi:MAG TPA: P-II family nitrogen regulator, partial [bacterium]|nr:P-II family nitrogen regulator [bacterium]